MQVRKEQAAAAQYTRNADDAVGWLAQSDSALSSVYSVLNTVRDLTVQAANSGHHERHRPRRLRHRVPCAEVGPRGRANTTYGTRSVFAGSSPTRRVRPGHRMGAAGTGVNRRIGDGQTVRVDTSAAPGVRQRR